MIFKLIHPTPISWFLLFNSGKSIPRVLSYKGYRSGYRWGMSWKYICRALQLPVRFQWPPYFLGAHHLLSTPEQVPAFEGSIFYQKRPQLVSTDGDNVNSPAKAERRTCQSQLGRNHLVQRKRGQRIITVCHEGAGNRGWEGVSIVRYTWNDPDT